MSDHRGGTVSDRKMLWACYAYFAAILTLLVVWGYSSWQFVMAEGDLWAVGIIGAIATWAAARTHFTNLSRRWHRERGYSMWPQEPTDAE